MTREKMIEWVYRCLSLALSASEVAASHQYDHYPPRGSFMDGVVAANHAADCYKKASQVSKNITWLPLEEASIRAHNVAKATALGMAFANAAKKGTWSKLWTDYDEVHAWIIQEVS